MCDGISTGWFFRTCNTRGGLALLAGAGVLVAAVCGGCPGQANLDDAALVRAVAGEFSDAPNPTDTTVPAGDPE